MVTVLHSISLNADCVGSSVPICRHLGPVMADSTHGNKRLCNTYAMWVIVPKCHLEKHFAARFKS